jgi:hypothetical protein
MNLDRISSDPAEICFGRGDRLSARRRDHLATGPDEHDEKCSGETYSRHHLFRPDYYEHTLVVRVSRIMRFPAETPALLWRALAGLEVRHFFERFRDQEPEIIGFRFTRHGLDRQHFFLKIDVAGLLPG